MKTTLILLQDIINTIAAVLVHQLIYGHCNDFPTWFFIVGILACKICATVSFAAFLIHFHDGIIAPLIKKLKRDKENTKKAEAVLCQMKSLNSVIDGEKPSK